MQTSQANRSFASACGVKCVGAFVVSCCRALCGRLCGVGVPLLLNVVLWRRSVVPLGLLPVRGCCGIRVVAEMFWPRDDLRGGRMGGRLSQSVRGSAFDQRRVCCCPGLYFSLLVHVLEPALVAMLATPLPVEMPAELNVESCRDGSLVPS